MRLVKILILSSFILSQNSVLTAQSSAVEWIDEVIKTSKSVKSLSYTMYSLERKQDGSYHKGASFTKLNIQPFKLYLRLNGNENKGVALLFNKQESNNLALISPAKWLPTFKLDPRGTMMRRNQHHTLYEAGFAYGLGVVEHYKNMDPEIFKSSATLETQCLECGTDFVKVTIIDPKFSYKPYTPLSNETLYDISKKLFVSEYLLVEKNNKVKDYFDDLQGKTLLVSTSYAKKTVILIDKNKKLPAVLEMHDEKGLFERYVFSNLKVNPSFSENEFSKDFENNGF